MNETPRRPFIDRLGIVLCGRSSRVAMGVLKSVDQLPVGGLGLILAIVLVFGLGGVLVMCANCMKPKRKENAEKGENKAEDSAPAEKNEDRPTDSKQQENEVKKEGENLPLDQKQAFVSQPSQPPSVASQHPHYVSYGGKTEKLSKVGKAVTDGSGSGLPPPPSVSGMNESEERYQTFFAVDPDFRASNPLSGGKKKKRTAKTSQQATAKASTMESPNKAMVNGCSAKNGPRKSGNSTSRKKTAARSMASKHGNASMASTATTGSKAAPERVTSRLITASTDTKTAPTLPTIGASKATSLRQTANPSQSPSLGVGRKTTVI